MKKEHREYAAITTIEILANKKLAGESKSRNAHESLNAIGMPTNQAIAIANEAIKSITRELKVLTFRIELKELNTDSSDLH